MLTKITTKPMQPLNGCARRAHAIAHVVGGRGLGFPDYGACQMPPVRTLHLMTWGCNFTRETIGQYPELEWVWVGVVTGEDGQLRDNFERLL